MSSPRSLQYRIRIILCVVAFISFLVAATVVGRQQFVAGQQEYATVMRAQVKIAKSLIPAQLLQHDAYLQMITSQLQDDDVQTVLAGIEANLSNYDPLDIYYVINQQGRIVQISRKFSPYFGFNPSRMDHVKEGRKISRVFQSIFSKRSVVALLYPLNHNLRLIYERDVRNILPALDHLEKGKIFKEQSVMVLTSEGIAAYHPDQSLVQSRHNILFDLKRQTEPSSNGLHTYVYHGQKYYAYREDLEIPQGWSVYLQVPSYLLSTDIIKSIVFQLSGMLVLFCVLTLALQTVLTRFFSQPVQDIVSSLAQFDPKQQQIVIPNTHNTGVLEFSLIRESINQLAQDIADSNRQLHIREERIRLLLNSTAEGIYGLDMEGKCIFCNDSFLRIMGFAREEDLLGKIIHDIIHHSQVDGLKCRADACPAHQGFLEGRGTHSENEFFWRADGSCFPVECWSYPMRNGNGVTGAVVSFMDITKRKEVENALVESERKYRALIETTDTGYVVVDKQGYVLDANAQYTRMTGYEQMDEILGRNVIEWTAEYDKERNAAEVKKCFDKGFVRGLDVDYVSRAGNITPIEVNATVIDHEDKKVILAMIRDMSERRHAERTLSAEKELLAVTLRSIGDGVITTNIDGRIMQINKIAENLTGWTQQEALGRPLAEVFNIVNEKTRQSCDSPVRKVLASGQITGLANNTALIARDGRERKIADSGAPIRDAQSHVIGVVLVFRDVTEQLRTEEELQKVKKLESVGVLAGGIAHDFNNILVAILGNINLVSQCVKENDTAYPLLVAAEKAALRAKDLTQQLLTFSKGGEPVKETASIQQVICDSADFILHGGNVACTYNMPDDLWLVEIDKGQMSQVIQNIIINAKQAMLEGGEVHVSCENVPAIVNKDIFLLPRGDYIKINISDNGPGIPEDVVDKIFDPYFSTKKEGSGLGLAVTDSIIKKHGGNISVFSKPGAGTIFTIYLPASFQKKLEVKEEILGPTREGINVLVMDDEETIRTITKTMFENFGHTVVLAKDGKEAINHYRELYNSANPVDVIIMDLTIPGGMGGEEAVNEILAINPAAKVIVSSGYSNDPIMAHYQDYGFKAAIIKPYQLQELMSVVNKVLL